MEISSVIPTVKRVTGFKVYLTNPSLRSALFSPLSQADDEMGNVVETAILSQWMHRDNLDLTYARWKNGRKKGEVGLVLLDDRVFKPLWGIEIKWSNRYFEAPKKLKSLIQFCKANNFNKAVVTSIDKAGTKEVEGVGLTFVPSALYAYTIGLNTLQMRPV